MKAFQFGVAGFIIGALLGLGVGVGQTRYLNKTEKNNVGGITIIGWAIGFAIGGALAGSNLGAKIEQEEKDKKIKAEARAIEEEKERAENQRIFNIKRALGIQHYETKCYKEGRYWTGVTTWTDARNGNAYTLKTERSPTGELLTALNGKYIITHDVNSANKDVIPVLTDKSRDTLFRRLIARYDADESFTIEEAFDLKAI